MDDQFDDLQKTDINKMIHPCFNNVKIKKAECSLLTI